MSEFSFSLEFIPGVDNDIADSLSRLCRNNIIDSPKEYSPEYILSALHIESYKPSPSQYSKIGMLHNTAVGHYGLERTLKRFKDLKDTWEYQRQHIRYFIDHCPCCQKMNMLKIPIHAHGFKTSTYTPMEYLDNDFIGPFPDQGYILIIVDTFTRWVELYHTTDVGQSKMQLTCCGTTRNYRKIRLQSSLLNCVAKCLNEMQPTATLQRCVCVFLLF